MDEGGSRRRTGWWKEVETEYPEIFFRIAENPLGFNSEEFRLQRALRGSSSLYNQYQKCLKRKSSSGATTADKSSNATPPNPNDECYFDWVGWRLGLSVKMARGWEMGTKLNEVMAFHDCILRKELDKQPQDILDDMIRPNRNNPLLFSEKEGHPCEKERKAVEASLEGYEDKIAKMLQAIEENNTERRKDKELGECFVDDYTEPTTECVMEKKCKAPLSAWRICKQSNTDTSASNDKEEGTERRCINEATEMIECWAAYHLGYLQKTQTRS